MKVFFNPNQNVETNSVSPSSKKPKYVVESWLNIEPNLEICSFDPVTIEDFKTIHNPHFVDDIFNLKINNGFMNKDPYIPESLRWTAGSMVAATFEAIKSNSCTISPTSGFHHSEYDSAQGFCTFNGLMLAVKKVLDRNLVNKIAVVDLDMHYGNGTDNISKKLNLTDRIYNYTFGDLGIVYPNQSEQWLKELPIVMKYLCENYQLIVYQAGADPHIDDPLGGVLTDEQLYRRDDIIFKICKEYNRPIVWNLAGGYQTPLRKVLDIHDNTLRACLKYFN